MKYGDLTPFKTKCGEPIYIGDVINDTQDTEQGEQNFVRTVIWDDKNGSIAFLNVANGRLSYQKDNTNHLYFSKVNPVFIVSKHSDRQTITFKHGDGIVIINDYLDGGVVILGEKGEKRQAINLRKSNQ